MILRDFLGKINIQKTAEQLADYDINTYLDMGIEINDLPNKRQKLINAFLKGIEELKRVLNESDSKIREDIVTFKPTLLDLKAYEPVVRKNCDIYATTFWDWKEWNNYEIKLSDNLDIDNATFWILKDIFFFGLAYEEHNRRVDEINEELNKPIDPNAPTYSCEEVFERLREEIDKYKKD